MTYFFEKFLFRLEIFNFNGKNQDLLNFIKIRKLFIVTQKQKTFSSNILHKYAYHTHTKKFAIALNPYLVASLNINVTFLAYLNVRKIRKNSLSYLRLGTEQFEKVWFHGVRATFSTRCLKATHATPDLQPWQQKVDKKIKMRDFLWETNGVASARLIVPTKHTKMSEFKNVFEDLI